MVTSRRLGSQARTIVLCGMGLMAGLSMLVGLVVGVRRADSAAHELVGRAVPAQAALLAASAAVSNSRTFLIAALEAADPASRAAALVAAETARTSADVAWARYLRHALHRPGELAVQRSYESAGARFLALATSLIGTTPASTTPAEENDAFERQIAALGTLQSKFYGPIVRDDAAVVVSGIARVRSTSYVLYGALAAVFTVSGLWLMRGARRDENLLISDADTMRAVAQHAELETSLQHALEMEPTEESTYPVIAQALTIVTPDFPAELLLADSSQAHFRQVLSTGPDANAACLVGAPAECPATASGQTRVFEDSSNLDTCPFLRGRDDSVWAICVPVSIAGRTTGVIHVQGPTQLPPGGNTRALELVGRKTGERIGMLRAFARSETQARTDPLTGLLNRRSLEARTHDLADAGLSFVVAYGDLDQFKMLNDVHGHDIGDRALRLFARVLRDNVRPNDIPARYGGEEFVTVLPDCTVDNAIAVVERIRTHLRAALVNGSVPPFTVSFGLAASEPGLTFSQTVDAADQALLHAKRTGRDRVIVAGADPTDSDPIEVPGDLSPESACS